MPGAGGAATRAVAIEHPVLSATYVSPAVFDPGLA
jgi:hypothetical protein